MGKKTLPENCFNIPVTFIKGWNNKYITELWILQRLMFPLFYTFDYFLKSGQYSYNVNCVFVNHSSFESSHTDRYLDVAFNLWFSPELSFTLYIWQLHCRLQNEIDKDSKVLILISFHSEILCNIKETNLSLQDLDSKTKISNSNFNFFVVEQMSGCMSSIPYGAIRGLMLFNIFIS